MIKVALLVRLEAKFLRDSLSLVEEEPATTTWFAMRMSPSTFGIFDAFPDEEGRQAHLGGKVAAALAERTPELFAQPPVIEDVDIIALKFPRV